ncbi:MAG: class I SAM-dependent methyltransferase [Candidatus Hydrogenedentes bacterium]|nr:class I SAM-dependent methyltransferase [Candidatus Hydrogenedentota bacterium]
MFVVPEEIEEYALVHSSREDPLLQALAQDTQANTKWPQMQTGHVEGSFLRMLVQVSKARRVLEIGTFTGYSALSMAMGLPEDGRVITCDVDPEATATARRYWEKSGQGAKIDLRLGPALETIESLEGPFDFVFIDADKENYVNYWEAVLPKVRQGGLIAVDNVLWSGRVLDPKDTLDHAVVAFNRHVRYDDRVELVMLTVRDGVTLARKK